MKKLMAVLVLTGACASMGTKSEAKKSDAVAVQDQAATQFQKAADAQKLASEEQAKADAADAKVAAAQKSLAEARAEARGQHLKARQAQQTARDLARQSSEQGMQAQERASTLQDKSVKDGDQKIQERQQTWMNEQNLEGQVLEAKGDSLKVRTQDRKDLSLDLSEATSVQIDGKQAQAAQIKPGDDVRASYQMVDGKARALQIEVQSVDAQPMDKAMTPNDNENGTSTTSAPSERINPNPPEPRD